MKRPIALPIVVVLLLGAGLLLLYAVKSISSSNIGPSPATATPTRSLSLHDAAAKGDLQAIKDAAAKKQNLDAPFQGGDASRKGWTPLMVAAADGKAETVRALLQAGAKYDVRADDGTTALHAAAAKGELGSLQALIGAGAGIDNKTNTGRTALMLAAESGNADKVKALLAAQAAAGTTDNDGNTPLALAVIGPSDTAALVVLLETRDAPADKPDTKGVTPLMKAVDRADLAKVILLLNSGANPSTKDAAGKSATDRALARTDAGGKDVAAVLAQAAQK